MAGKLVYFELPAKDVARAQQFYGSLFDWSFQATEAPVPYVMAQTASEDSAGAIYGTEGDERTPVVYFDTDDIDASIARVHELGGKAEEKSPVPGHGWYAPCRDTEGTAFSLWQSDESAAMPG